MAPSNVLLVGSIGLDSAEDVFNQIPSALPQRLNTIPDGESGERDLYIYWQANCFPQETRRLEYGGKPLVGERLPYTIDSVRPTGYDDAAIASYRQLIVARAKGTVPTSVRFQVGLPTPLNAVLWHTRPDFHKEILPLYAQRMEETISKITASIPHDDIVIQWDMVWEIMTLERERGYPPAQNELFKVPYSDVREGIVRTFVDLAKKVPVGISQALHLCYGDLNNKHLIEPEDLGTAVDFASEVIEELSDTHKVEWVHMPVPKGRIDEAYYAPLRRLRLNGARLCLGLVHGLDEEGTRKRIEVAQKTLPGVDFGVATECGLARTPEDERNSAFQIMKVITADCSSED